MSIHQLEVGVLRGVWLLKQEKSSKKLDKTSTSKYRLRSTAT